MAEELKFGTSGLRGLASLLQGSAARRHAAAFLRHVTATSGRGAGRLLLGRDLRASSPAILADCAVAVRAASWVPVDCGALPTPALALHAMALGAPAIMVTGSHIPADRNGLKFYLPTGEIGKSDEAAILAGLTDDVPEAAAATEDGSAAAGDRYRQRYRNLLAANALDGWRIGVFEHSTVLRDILASLLTRAGADVVRLARSEDFVPVDTEAFGDRVYDQRHQWLRQHHLDAIVSSDGDGDRPLVVDAAGNFVRGDALGLLAARFVGADVLVTPVTSNSGLEDGGSFAHVERTRVGSPYVIAGMADAASRGRVVVGFEANGGVLLGSDVIVNGRPLAALPTRDAVLPILALFAAAAEAGPIAEVVAALPLRVAMADRLQDVSSEASTAFLRKLVEAEGYATNFFAGLGQVQSVSTLDGPRFTLVSGDIVHFRASGNAPELRCYVEAATPEAAKALLGRALESVTLAVRAPTPEPA